ncbi:hypothetical protein QQ008_01355 [Fulvivirgaceae bacterium BMA10]|uniref:3-deoxy-manno-octulosonate cytidylyltransferase n=1 Tax=Splendidivirga corallicola TaxID=3051826 RepID=A0ABT8KGX6_9BACT|nr:hypothetical protein [Fulvivirgaceae bacterium BMA10]
MKIGIIILCRYSSSRLPGKILKKINGKTILERIVERLEKVSKAHQVIVATSDEQSDDAIEIFCHDNDIPVFRGDLDNVAKRFLDCALHHELDYAIRINGDNIFADPVIIDQMIEILDDRSYDLVTNVPERTFPIGMSVEILKTSFYQQILKKFTTKDYLEHVTLYLYDHPTAGDFFYFYNKTCPQAKGLKLAVDDAFDLENISRIISELEKSKSFYSLTEIYDAINKLNNE